MTMSELAGNHNTNLEIYMGNIVCDRFKYIEKAGPSVWQMF